MLLRVLLLSLLTSWSVMAMPTRFVEGQDYQVVASKTTEQAKELRVFFSYNCPHCYRHQSVIEATMPKLSEPLPLVWNPVGVGRKTWALSQLAHLIAERYNKRAIMQMELFERIHERGMPLQSRNDVAAFLAPFGIDKQEVLKVSKDPQLARQMEQLDRRAFNAEISGVPSLLVNGRYLVSAKINDAEVLADLIDYLSELN
ncbi:thiol:disulfide interchange protein DsbA/DsbL [Paraferrimonas sedimenticola]|uniref:Thiol:disulfide interchange protein n=1 Tax=Paraferrimonas sedimenticola TaxID=375674 RepID=A0AA37RXZ4_9GAMM|nr:thiol:disulfide interchange protein DsbA/DsbL [Paraferrimonas sedimenticola]GLP96682.1 thiol:disulfide interchange protein [Paraferrimonas sedimenticola]